MGLEFYLTDENQNHNYHIHPLNLHLSYGSFDDLRDQIERIAKNSSLLNIQNHPGLIAYQQVMDAQDMLSTKECLDLYTLLKTSAFDDLEQNTVYETFMQALHAAIIQQKLLIWS